jgi:hypothetical protein
LHSRRNRLNGTDSCNELRELPAAKSLSRPNTACPARGTGLPGLNAPGIQSHHLALSLDLCPERRVTEKPSDERSRLIGIDVELH